jgi:hypothetical protein
VISGSKLEVAGGAVLLAMSAVPQTTAPISACQLSAEADAFVGGHVQVHGYVINLSSHGFILVADKNCKTDALIQLDVGSAMHATLVFAETAGPREATLSGTMKWGKTQLGNRIPVLEVETVDQVSSADTPWSAIK